MMQGYSLLAVSKGREEEVFWKSMYYKQMDHKQREVARRLIKQIENAIEQV